MDGSRKEKDTRDLTIKDQGRVQIKMLLMMMVMMMMMLLMQDS